MIPLSQLTFFILASIALIFTPGPDIIYVVTRGIAQGRKAALAAAAGFALGNFVHILLSVIGLSALLAASTIAFATVKWAGAAYLVYLGVQMIRSTSTVPLTADAPVLSAWRVFQQSIIANIMNPKVILFFLAFFPQFINADRGNPQVQIILLGTLFVVLVMICFGTVGLCSGWFGQLLRRNARAELLIGKIAGSVLILLGVSLALG